MTENPNGVQDFLMGIVCGGVVSFVVLIVIGIFTNRRKR